MTWTTFLSLILFFDKNLSTQETLRSLKGYPELLFRRINDGKRQEGVLFETDELNSLLKQMDEQALHTLRTMILVEYARCRKIPGDIIVKSFDGVDFFTPSSDEETEKALKNIKSRQNEQF